ncbi:septation ring formation regulator EzrA [Melaminivora suipulveris]|uniref:Cell division protein FtsB n=1 Tax=Melaminivora suipulveris TaxID=2109913 RepID=A0A2R3QEF7_9BURK|nr:septum formation initiator family protein [Melaminivora suipulveris]AVO50152.1 septation ring formation regulator EzrA [Melaminivora suipulveris]
MGNRTVALVLLLLLVGIHAQLWEGRGSIPQVREMRSQLAAQQGANERARQANERLAAEVQDLREGLDMVEERARTELGMVRQGEIYVQVVPARR